MTQHDSHEFMVYLLDQLQSEVLLSDLPKFNGDDNTRGFQTLINDFNTSYPTVIDQVFGGLMQTYVKCGKCKHNSVTNCPFMTQSLQHKSSLVKCLKDFYDEHQIDDTYKCEKCSKKSKAKKSHKIVKLPQIFIAHIKRFDDSMEKITADTKYTSKLDLSQ